MALEEYKKRRKFKDTPEPTGEAEKPEKLLRFVVQKHKSSHLHYDFRIELDGVLKSWAVPKGVPVTEKDKRLAIMVEDHPLNYSNFEGVIPKGNYGAGSVIVWDKGSYYVEATNNPKESEQKIRDGLRKGHISFYLKGNKIFGEFSLVKIKGTDNDWLFLKREDGFVKKDESSILSRRTVEELSGADINIGNLPSKDFPHNIKPMLAESIDKPFNDKNWIFEIKWDGYRAIAQIYKNNINLHSRNLKSFKNDYPEIVESLKKITDDVILDGEIVVLDKNGKPSFQLLQNYQKTGEGTLVFFVFDILYLKKHDLRNLELIKRRKILKQFLPQFINIKFTDYVDEGGVDFFNAAVKENTEGIIGKEKTSVYLAGKRSKTWLKIKTHLRQEAVIVGFTKPKGSRKEFGALILGVYKDNDLIYVGHTGTGFNQNLLIEIKNRLTPLIQPKSPFKNPPKTNEKAYWIKPELVCEVSFAEWTKEGHMRQPVFIGLREDKNAKEVRREKPIISKINRNDKIKLTNLNKLFWPEEGYTKKDLIDYYSDISGYILPYLIDRPESLHRFPNGIKGESFFQKNVDSLPPRWVKIVKIYSETDEKEINYIVCQDKDTLIYLANLGCIEINPWNSRIDHLDNPDYLVIDLDPVEISFDRVVDTAVAVREILEDLGIKSYCRTSGATGLHIYIPLQALYKYSQVRQFARIIAILVNKKTADFTSLERRPEKRRGRVYIDYLQNSRGQTMVAPYSVRPRPKAPVSTPLRWEELSKKLDPTGFTIKTIFRRLEKFGDIFKPVLGKGANIENALRVLTSSSSSSSLV